MAMVSSMKNIIRLVIFRFDRLCWWFTISAFWFILFIGVLYGILILLFFISFCFSFLFDFWFVGILVDCCGCEEDVFVFDWIEDEDFWGFWLEFLDFGGEMLGEAVEFIFLLDLLFVEEDVEVMFFIFVGSELDGVVWGRIDWVIVGGLVVRGCGWGICVLVCVVCGGELVVGCESGDGGICFENIIEGGIGNRFIIKGFICYCCMKVFCGFGGNIFGIKGGGGGNLGIVVFFFFFFGGIWKGRKLGKLGIFIMGGGKGNLLLNIGLVKLVGDCGFDWVWLLVGDEGVVFWLVVVVLLFGFFSVWKILWILVYVFVFIKIKKINKKF